MYNNNDKIESYTFKYYNREKENNYYDMPTIKSISLNLKAFIKA